jgi:hypothetical protein
VAAGGTRTDSFDAWTRVIGRARPGERVAVEVDRRGTRLPLTLTIRENPDIDVVLGEQRGAVLTPAQESFRRAWLASKATMAVAW